MRFIRLASAMLFAIALPWLPAHAAQAVPGQPAPGFSLTGADGKMHSLADYRDKIVVLEWTNPDCPYVGKHYKSGTMQALQRDMTAQGVAWLRIDSSAPDHEGYVAPKNAAAQVGRDGSHETLFLADPDGKVGHLYGATATPDMMVIDQAGILRYSGAIDDAPSADPATLTNAKSYVRSAVAALKNNRTVDPAVTQPYGCSIKYAE